MTITIKFDLGRTVYVLYNNRVSPVIIKGFIVTGDEDGTIVNYRVRFPAGGHDTISENLLFETKEELLESL